MPPNRNIKKYSVKDSLYYKGYEDNLYACGKDNRVRLYNIGGLDLKRVFTFVGHTMPVYRLIVAPDKVYSFSYDGTIRLWG